jgi:hypothetical protein
MANHAAVVAIAALSDAQGVQVLYQLTVWLIAADQHEIPLSARLVLDQIVLFASSYRGGR